MFKFSEEVLRLTLSVKMSAFLYSYVYFFEKVLAHTPYGPSIITGSTNRL